MRIAVLTSSRADYSIYLPLLKKIKQEPNFSLKIIAFGTHLSKLHGYTLNAIYEDGFDVYKAIKTPFKNNAPADISNAIGKTIIEFASFWKSTQNEIDLIVCLGDRYEMFAAITANSPFNIPVAHLYGGDTTLGAFDNAFRHAITCMSTYHFTSLESSAKRVAQLINTTENVHCVGSLSIDSIRETTILTNDEFKEKFGIELQNPILVSFHPETIAYEKNEFYVNELIAVLSTFEQQIIITMPNADTMGDIIRKAFVDFSRGRKNIYIVESLGTVGYYSCLEHCKFVIGNSSSGIAEAASFGKYVINLGDRQKGRESGKNVIHCVVQRNEILNSVLKIKSLPVLNRDNIYGDGNSADRIIRILKTIS